MHGIRASAVFAATFVVAAISAGAAARSAEEGVVRIVTRPDVEQRFYLIVPERPVLAAVLFSGGTGNVAVEKLGPGRFLDRGNFLVKSRYFFADEGIAVAIPGASSDLPSGHTAVSRHTDEHIRDIAGVVAYLKKKLDLPVWLVGVSAGTESAASVGIALGNRIAGIVFASSITQSSQHRTSILALNLGAISVPVLAVAHRQDGCVTTPPFGADKVVAASTASPRKKTIYFEKIDRITSAPCRSASPHGFIGIEKEVVAAIAGFMKER